MRRADRAREQEWGQKAMMKQKPTRTPVLHLVKLCVGADEVADLGAWQKARSAERRAEGLDPRPRHVTRMPPRRADELLAGGSLFWVFRGVIRARQRLLAIDPIICDDGLTRYELVLDAKLTPTEPVSRRPFQGWRYLSPADAPADLDLGMAKKAAGLPLALREAVAEYGVV